MTPDELGFDLYAMARPKTRADLIALADEALSELQSINEHLDKLFKPEPP